MTVILVLATFLVFIVVDYALNRRKALATVPVEAAPAVPAPLGGDFVDGFQVPDNISYHPGHSWLVTRAEKRGPRGRGRVRRGASRQNRKHRIAQARPMDPAGTEGPFLLSGWREDRNGVADRRRSYGSQRRSAPQSRRPAAGSLRQRLAGDGTRSRRGKHHPQPRPQRPGPRVDAASPSSTCIPCNPLWLGQLQPMADAPPRISWAASRTPIGRKVTGEFFLTA